MYWSKQGIIQALLVRFHNKGTLASSWPDKREARTKETRIDLKKTELPFNVASLFYPLSNKTTTQNTRQQANPLSHQKTTLSQTLLFITVLLFMFLQESKQQSLLTSTQLMPSSKRQESTSFLVPPSIFPASPKFKFTSSSSSRHIYPKTSFSDDPSKIILSSSNRENDEKHSLHKTRLINLKRLLDSYSYSLSAGNIDELNSRQMTQLGSSCIAAIDCSKSVANSHCNLDSFTCSCLPNHIEHNSTTCLPPSLLGYECLVDAQCQKKVQNSICLNKLCACPNEFVAYRKDKCLSASKLNDYCLTDKQCELNDKHSYCKWKIQHVYGVCKCPPNYKHISVELARPTISNNSTGSNATLFRENLSTNLTTATRCAPRLGDICLENSECQLATPNSQCKEVPNNLKISWQTSRSSSSRRCQCLENYVESHDKMSCKQLEQKLSGTTSAIIDHSSPSSMRNPTWLQNTTPAPIVTVLNSNMDAKHHYELLSAFNESSSTASFSNSNSKDSAGSEVTGAMTTPITSASILNNSKNFNKQQVENQSSKELLPSKPSRIRVSSLGKVCKSKVECQLRDPHSDCINGICECKKPTAKCSAKSTGCHEDTFQCRNGQCISWYFVCDQFKNCDDGSDEDECLSKFCPPQAFQCDNGSCIARGKICNGKWDCPDGSDERSCFQNIKQKEANLANVSTNSNNKEEVEQQLFSTNQSEQDRCDSRAFTCSNGQCLPSYVFCNAVEDCADGSDERPHFCEANAHRKWSTGHQGNQILILPGDHQFQNVTSLDISSLESQLSTNISSSGGGGASTSTQASISISSQDSPLLKTDRNSINKMLAALNAAQIASRNNNNNNNNLNNRNRGAKSWFRDNNDEMIFGQRRRGDARGRDNRPTVTSSSTHNNNNNNNNHQDDQKCPRESFTCRNGKCRSTAILCSGIDGCGDNSDENRCEVCQCEAA